MEWTATMRTALGIEISLPAQNGAQRQRQMLESGASLGDVYSATVAATRETYAGALEPQRR
jgi:hypothetical protein